MKDYCAGATDKVNHPKHYTGLGVVCPKCGADIEAIEVSEKFNFNIGNAIKYLWRHLFKGHPIEDLQKAVFYINREVERMSKSEKKRGNDSGI